MGQPSISKKRLIDTFLAFALLLAASEGEQPSDEPEAKAGTKTVKEPCRREWFLRFLDRNVYGTLTLPTEERVRAAVRPSKDADVREQSMDDVLDQLERAAKQSDSRTRTAMTASAFALAVAGLLLKERAEIDIVPQVTVVGAALALCGVVAGVLGHQFYVGRRPVQRPCMRDVLNGRALLVRKEFYATLAAILATFALLIQSLSITFGAGQRQTRPPTQNTTAPAASIHIAIVYSGGQATPHRTTGTESRSRPRPARGMSSLRP